jgi:GST-like protein
VITEKPRGAISAFGPAAAAALVSRAATTGQRTVRPSRKGILPMIDVHYWPTPNGKKVTILLEECGLPYKIVACNIQRGDQFTPEFLAINPNHRMPVIVDHEPKGGGAPISVFESGAIMMYIAEKVGRFWPQDLRGKYAVTEWLIWQMANQGPKLGECGHFRRAGPEAGDLTYAINRFTDEANRLYGVLNNRFYKSRYVAGDEYTIADMISYPWTVNWKAQGQDIEEFKHFKRWFDELSERPAVKRGMAAGTDLPPDPASLTDEQRAQIRKIMYNQRAIPVPA